MTKQFKLPEDHEKYRKIIESGSGGNSIEELMKRLKNEKHLATTNLPVFVIAASTQAAYATILRLEEAGFLK